MNKKENSRGGYAKKILLCLMLCVCCILSIGITIRLNLLFSIIIFLACLFSFVGVSLLFCSMFKPFVETEKHQVLFPKIQCAIGIVFVVINMIFYSNALSSFIEFSFLSNDYVCYYSNLLIGMLLILATRVKKIGLFQLIHVIILPVLFALSLSFSERYYVDIVIYVLILFSIFHVVISDKRVVTKFHNTMKQITRL